MPATRSPAQQAAARANGARSHGPITEAGKARSARNGARHGLRGRPFALLPGEDHEEFAALHAAVTSDWGPRDAYDPSDSGAVRRVMELVTSLWRQDRLRGLELAALAAAGKESPPSEASMKRLLTFARYGARIDKDSGRALYALRILRNRPDAGIDELQDGTCEPGSAVALTPDFTDELSPRTFEPRARGPHEPNCTIEFAARTLEPEPANNNLELRTAEPEPPTLNRHQRQRLQALARKRRAA